MPASSARDTAWRWSDGSPRVMSPPTAPHPNPNAETFRPVLPNGRCCMTLLCTNAERRGIVDEVPGAQTTRLQADDHDIASRPGQVLTRADLAQVARGDALQRLSPKVCVANDAQRAADFHPAKRKVVIRDDRHGAALLLDMPQLDVLATSNDAET